MRYAQVFSIRDERIVRMKTYLDRAAAFEAAGTRVPGE
jgi:ketosteroid isomerase-like protein